MAWTDEALCSSPRSDARVRVRHCAAQRRARPPWRRGQEPGHEQGPARAHAPGHAQRLPGQGRPGPATAAPDVAAGAREAAPRYTGRESRFTALISIYGADLGGGSALSAASRAASLAAGPAL